MDLVHHDSSIHPFPATGPVQMTHYFGVLPFPLDWLLWPLSFVEGLLEIQVDGIEMGWSCMVHDIHGSKSLVPYCEAEWTASQWVRIHVFRVAVTWIYTTDMSGDVSQSDWDASGYHSISYISLVN